MEAVVVLETRRFYGFRIMAEESDFMPIAMRIRQDGLPVYGFGTSKTPEAFKQACTRFIDVAALGKAGEGVSAADTAPAATRESEPRGKHEPIDPDLVKLLIDAYNAAKRDERGFVSLNDRSEEHTSELQSLMRISYAVFCLKKKKEQQTTTHKRQIPTTQTDN